MKLREIREAKGITLTQVAELTNIPYRTLQDIESGKIEKTKYENLYLVADALGCLVDELVALPEYRIELHITNKGNSVLFVTTSRREAITTYVKYYLETTLENEPFKRITLYKEDVELCRFQLEQIGNDVVEKHSCNKEYIAYDPIYNYKHKKPF